MLDLLKLSLRLHPEILVPAEMREKEALTVQEAGRTGHTIVSTLHANSARTAYDRILTMCLSPGTKQYTYDYLLPDKTAKGYWLYDGFYYVRIIGHK